MSNNTTFTARTVTTLEIDLFNDWKQRLSDPLGTLVICANEDDVRLMQGFLSTWVEDDVPFITVNELNQEPVVIAFDNLLDKSEKVVNNPKMSGPSNATLSRKINRAAVKTAYIHLITNEWSTIVQEEYFTNGQSIHVRIFISPMAFMLLHALLTLKSKNDGVMFERIKTPSGTLHEIKNELLSIDQFDVMPRTVEVKTCKLLRGNELRLK